MAKKDYILRKIQELEREERERREQKKKAEKPYKPSSMNMAKMPLGCWIWLLLLGAAAVYGLMKLFAGVG